VRLWEALFEFGLLLVRLGMGLVDLDYKRPTGRIQLELLVRDFFSWCSGWSQSVLNINSIIFRMLLNDKVALVR